GTKLTKEDIKNISNIVIDELKNWGYIKEVEVISPTWIEVAYTWEWPGSRLKEEVLIFLKNNNINSVGRYGKWKFQGIAESIRDGLSVI
ncbi:MAG: protoporphyrinogen oxidase-like protein, partial [Candidatus Aenigmarchaeota archaeon]|nr:protoporphyrinogen oxidase-like protein [Candidatus Aenigmarchaeota archaeon]MDW8149023.1 protoporphyrinogen oxidase-like protein [Candidatus Aenigmarchaeota archaeon]